jgi:predicted transcriptional regulator
MRDKMKTLSKIKMDMLRLLWLVNKPMHLREISDRMNLKARCVNMHILNLMKRGYVAKSNSKFYMLTDLGREILGFPRIDEALARKILSEVPQERAFHFYIGIGKPLMIYSNSLIDFCEKIRHINLESIEFHASRGDFERWIQSLGDDELASRLRIIRESNLSGENLREEIFRVVKLRCDELGRAASGS